MLPVRYFAIERELAERQAPRIADRITDLVADDVALHEAQHAIDWARAKPLARRDVLVTAIPRDDEDLATDLELGTQQLSAYLSELAHEHAIPHEALLEAAWPAIAPGNAPDRTTYASAALIRELAAHFGERVEDRASPQQLAIATTRLATRSGAELSAAARAVWQRATASRSTQRACVAVIDTQAAPGARHPTTMRILVLVVAIAACRGNDGRPAELSNGFTVRLTWGGGATPSLDAIVVGGDGRVERTFDAAGSALRQSSTIDAAEVAELRAALQSADFAALAPSYGMPIAGGDILELEVEPPVTRRIVRCDGSCNRVNDPPAFDEVVAIAMEIVHRIGPPAAPAPPRPLCVFDGALETISVDNHHLTRLSAGVNHYRDIEIEPVPTGSGGIDLVFVAYNADDYPPIAQWNGPDKPREHLVPHKSVVAHLARVRGELRIEPRDVDLHTGMSYRTRDHSYPCDHMGGDYLDRHPGEFLR